MMTTRQQIPSMPRWLLDGEQGAWPVAVRRFGDSVEDLAIDFRLARRPDLITDLLSACIYQANGTAAGREFWLKMPVGARIEALLALAARTDERAFAWRLHCSSSGCNADSEFELSIEQIIAMGKEHSDFHTKSIVMGPMEIEIRRPTGLDQMQWLSQSDELQIETMLRSMLVQPRLEELISQGVSLHSIAEAIDAAMEELDPILGFHLSVVCPQCGLATDVYPDLAGEAIERLSLAQRRAIEDVHRLASHYHWDEQQILSLPEWRRQSYLELIERGLQ